MAVSLRASAIVQMAVIAGALLMVSTSGFAQDETQSTPPPKDRDIVLHPTEPTQRRQGFVLTASVFEGYDERTVPGGSTSVRVVSSVPSTNAQRNLPNGFHSGASASLDYGRERDRSTISLRGQTSTTYFPALGRQLTTGGASASVQKQIGRRTRLSVSPSASYTPYWGLDLFDTVGAVGTSPSVSVQPSGLNAAVVYSPTYRYALDATVSQQISTRTSLSFFGVSQRTDLPDRHNRLANERFGGRFTHGLTSQVALNLGYSYWKVDYAGTATTAPLDGHDLDLGAIYHRTLSLSRKTAFSLVSGSTLASRGTTGTISGGDTAAQQSLHRTDFRLRVDAGLDHQMGQTWSARLAYRRNWMFVEGFGDPFFVDDIALNVGGRLNRRTTAATSLAYLHGTLGQGTQGNRYRSLGGAAVMRVMLNRSLTAFGQYQYYRFAFSNASALPTGFPDFFERNAVRGGLTLVLPPSR